MAGLFFWMAPMCRRHTLPYLGSCYFAITFTFFKVNESWEVSRLLSESSRIRTLSRWHCWIQCWWRYKKIPFPLLQLSSPGHSDLLQHIQYSLSKSRIDNLSPSKCSWRISWPPLPLPHLLLLLPLRTLRRETPSHFVPELALAILGAVRVLCHSASFSFKELEASVSMCLPIKGAPEAPLFSAARTTKSL